MLRLKTVIKFKMRVKGKCDKHPNFNPEKTGRGGVKGTCVACNRLCDVFEADHRLRIALAEFERLAKPFEVQKQSKKASA